MSVAVVAAATVFLRAAGQVEQLKISFETMLGSAEKAEVLMLRLTRFAAETPFELQDVAKNAKLLLAMGIELDKILPTMKALGDVAAGLSVPIERLALNLGQVKTQGHLTGRELRDFAVAGVPLIAELAKNLNLTKTEIKKLVSQGKIGFKDVEAAFISMSSKGGKFYNLMLKQNKSLFGQISNLKDNLFQLAVTIGNELLPATKKATEQLIKMTDTKNVTLWIKTIKISLLDIERSVKRLSAVINNLVPFKRFASEFVKNAKKIGGASNKAKGQLVEFKNELEGIEKINVNLIQSGDVNKAFLSDLSLQLIKIEEEFQNKKLNIQKSFQKKQEKVKKLELKIEKEKNKAIIKMEKTMFTEIARLIDENQEKIREYKDFFIRDVAEGIVNGNRDISDSFKDLGDTIKTDLVEKGLKKAIGAVTELAKGWFGLKSDASQISKAFGGALSGGMGIIAGGVISIIASIFGKGTKSVAEIAEEKFRKMVNNTNKALQQIGKERTIFEKQVDILRDLRGILGGDAAVPKQFTDELGVSIGTTIDGALANILGNIQNTNIREIQTIKGAIDNAQRELTFFRFIDEFRRANAQMIFAANQPGFGGGRNFEAINSLVSSFTGAAKSSGFGSEISGTDFSGSSVLGLFNKGKFSGANVAGNIGGLSQFIAQQQAKVSTQSTFTLDELRDTIRLANEIAEITGNLNLQFPVFNKGGIVPKFDGGGMIPGNSFNGDRVPILANSGEMILNKSQQANLFDQINGSGESGDTNSIVVNFTGPVLGDASQARDFAQRIDEELFKLKRNGESLSIPLES